MMSERFCGRMDSMMCVMCGTMCCGMPGMENSRTLLQ